MINTDMTIKNDILTITVDLTYDAGPSKSGKTTIIASTQGNKLVPGTDATIGLNIYRKR